MALKRQAALVLPAEHATSGEPHVFVGFPGRYVPDEPVAIAALGMTRSEARELLAASGLPLRETTVEAEEDPLERTAGMPSDADVESGPESTLEMDVGSYPGLSKTESDERDAYDAERQKQADAPEATVPEAVAGSGSVNEQPAEGEGS